MRSAKIHAEALNTISVPTTPIFGSLAQNSLLGFQLCSQNLTAISSSTQPKPSLHLFLPLLLLPWRRKWQPTPVFLPRESCGWGSLMGGCPWGCTESDWGDLLCMHALEKEMATHSSVLAWRIPGTQEPGGLPSMGSHRVGHDWSDLAAAAAASVLANDLFSHPSAPVFPSSRTTNPWVCSVNLTS